MPLKKIKMNKLKNIIKFFYYLCKYNVDFTCVFGIQKNNIFTKKVNLYPPYCINNCEIGDYTYIAKNANISYTKIGKYCSIGPNFLCGWGIHPLNGISTAPMFYSTRKQNGYTLSKEDKIEERKPIVIGNDVFIGANVTVLDGVTIGNGAVIGAGAVVSKDIPPYAIAVGCPIKIIKFRFNDEIINKLESIQWWNDDTNQVLIEKNFFDVENFIENYTK
jgi:chloramphenicol O-acetyltransferase